MPLQNRVTPFGEIVATPARGMFMGNRGRLHDDRRHLRRQFTSETRWLICVTRFKDRKRTPMTPGHYTELFFLDEATALAAGHRPCAECRHADFRRFKELWIAANRRTLGGGAANVSAERLDHHLQTERLNADGAKHSFQAKCDRLPDGVFVTLSSVSDAWMLWNRRLHRWTPHGYEESRPIPVATLVDVLTPRSTVRAIAGGYVPIVHPSAAPPCPLMSRT